MVPGSELHDLACILVVGVSLRRFTEDRKLYCGWAVSL